MLFLCVRSMSHAATFQVADVGENPASRSIFFFTLKGKKDTL